MNLVKIVESFIASYGQTFFIDQQTSKCILSSKDRLNADFLEQHIARSGITIKNVKDSYVMFCTPATKIEKDDTIEISGQLYQVNGVGYSYISDIAIYKWAVLVKGGSLS